ncbi:glycosyltransferase family 2 protein [Parabacteroides sp. TM07-1AC]|uniref:glycosyltransferase family 2 protein n=1 Tax=Parabacteroides sp. TM07-1AC TaxID=2292363 RepID=UPI000F002C9E|nr:glycosyltransferase family 2 protein [Parabacteroides sp. TM07-1AC]RHU30631.1 glycosyltransferase family 2 protein [Parabacteroides sp. TM07-1AC]
MQSKITIIVPVYKVEKYIYRCINSVLAQTYSNWELILVDDGSPDKCPIICDNYAKADGRIRVIHKENGGLSSARNVGLEYLSGDYVTFLDSDDFIHSDTLQDTLLLAEKENADIVQFSFLRGREDVFPSIKKETSVRRFDNHSIFCSSVQKIIVWGKLYRSELWKGIRMPIGKVNEDDATTWKLYYRSSRILYVNTPYYYYYKNSESIMANQKKVLKLDFISAYEERIAFFENEREKLLTDLSKWRFCLPLMLNYAYGNVKKTELPVLLKYFQLHVNAAINCSKVPLLHRFILSMFRIYPYFFRFLFMFLGRAHNL